MIVSSKIASMFRNCGFVNVDYLVEKKIYCEPSKILNILNRDWRKWIKPLCMIRSKPRTLDPNFGFETIGGSDGWLAQNCITGSWYSCPEAGVANSISFYGHSEFGGPAKYAIYKRTDNSLVGYSEEITIATYPTTQWWLANMIGSPSLLAEDYFLVYWSSGRLRDYYDTETNKGGTDIETYNSFPASWSPITLNIKASIYCTYTTPSKRGLFKGLFAGVVGKK